MHLYVCTCIQPSVWTCSYSEDQGATKPPAGAPSLPLSLCCLFAQLFHRGPFLSAPEGSTKRSGTQRQCCFCTLTVTKQRYKCWDGRKWQVFHGRSCRPPLPSLSHLQPQQICNHFCFAVELNDCLTKFDFSKTFSLQSRIS